MVMRVRFPLPAHLALQGYRIGGDEGYGHQLMDRMRKERFYLQRFNNGSPARRSEVYANLSAEWWSTIGQMIERRQTIIPNDEKLVAQLTSRRKLYDSKGREKLESKADLAARGVESPDRADALIGYLGTLPASLPQRKSGFLDCRVRKNDKTADRESPAFVCLSRFWMW
jgi:hypothetical protein